MDRSTPGFPVHHQLPELAQTHVHWVGNATKFLAFIYFLLSSLYMATHPSILVWRIPWTEEPGRLPSLGSQRVRHDWMILLSHPCLGASLVAQKLKNLPAIWDTQVWSLGREILWRREWLPLQYSCLENSMHRGAWWTTVHRFTRSRTWLSN